MVRFGMISPLVGDGSEGAKRPPRSGDVQGQQPLGGGMITPSPEPLPGGAEITEIRVQDIPPHG